MNLPSVPPSRYRYRSMFQERPSLKCPPAAVARWASDRTRSDAKPMPQSYQFALAKQANVARIRPTMELRASRDKRPIEAPAAAPGGAP